jgi:hypothetical protein
MTAPLPPLADRLRRHREVFTLALELGVTPREAEAVLAQRAAAARADQTRTLIAKPIRRRAETVTAPAPQPAPETPASPTFWWNRD